MQPVFRFNDQWRRLSGMAYGLHQPVLLGRAWVTLPQSLDWLALDAAMARLLPEPVPMAKLSDKPELALAERALHWVAAVQRASKLAVFEEGRVWLSDAPAGALGQLNVVVPYAAPRAAAQALAWVGQALAHFVVCGQLDPQGPQQAQHTFERLQAALRKLSLRGLNSYHFLRAARELDLPVRHVLEDVYAFGTGRGSRLLESSYTDQTSCIAARIAGDKMKTAQVLHQAGLPAPTHARATGPDHAVQLAQQLGYPVVIKPADAAQGRGVAADLRDEAAVLAAYQGATKHSKRILVEKHFHGTDHRLTVLNGRLIKTVMRVAGGVLGDGVQTVAQLVDAASSSGPLARRAHLRGETTLLSLDQEAHDVLAIHGLSAQSVPADGAYVCLRRRANVSAGGTPILLNAAQVHPDNRLLAERAAAALRLDLAGVDLLIPDISVSWLVSGALICEVNGQPQLGAGTSPEIFAQILQELMPAQVRLPVALVVSEDGQQGAALADDVAQKMAQLLAQQTRKPGRALGRSSAQGVWHGHQRLAPAQTHGFQAGQMLMCQPDLDAAIIVMSETELLRHGLPCDRCDVLVWAAAPQVLAPGTATPSALWPMVLPHVRKAAVVSAVPHAHQPSLLAVQALGLQWQTCNPDAAVLAQAAAALFTAALHHDLL